MASLKGDEPKPLDLFIKHVNRRLAELSWDKARLAKEMKQKPPAVSRWLSGKSAPGLDAVAKFAKALGVKPHELLSEEGPEPITPSVHSLTDCLMTTADAMGGPKASSWRAEALAKIAALDDKHLERVIDFTGVWEQAESFSEIAARHARAVAENQNAKVRKKS